MYCIATALPMIDHILRNAQHLKLKWMQYGENQNAVVSAESEIWAPQLTAMRMQWSMNEA